MTLKNFLLISAIVLLAHACSKETITEPNVFDDPSLKPPIDTSKAVSLEPGSFQYLYHFVFKATCANSGCHDGTFEPDFRTVYSSYNTLVNHPVIKNNATKDFLFRVDPGSPETSVIIERLTNDIDGKSGIMPLSVDADSDWPKKKDAYIEMIRAWIVKGAPDTYGNLPTTKNSPPQVIGIMAFPSGNTTDPLKRVNNKPTNPILIQNDPIDVWFAFSDDKTASNSFRLTRLKVSRDLFDFEGSTLQSMDPATALTGKDFWNNTTLFTHKTTLVFPTDTIGTYLFLRTYLQDDEQTDTTEIPDSGTNDIIRSYFTLKLDSL
jgi:hypothetical protein